MLLLDVLRTLRGVEYISVSIMGNVHSGRRGSTRNCDALNCRLLEETLRAVPCRVLSVEVRVRVERLDRSLCRAALQNIDWGRVDFETPEVHRVVRLGFASVAGVCWGYDWPEDLRAVTAGFSARAHCDFV